MLLACSDSATEYDRLNQWRFPLVYLDRIPVSPGHGTIATDNVEAGQLATKYLVGLGHMEVKLPGRKVSEDQAAWHARAFSNWVNCVTVTSVGEAITWARRWNDSVRRMRGAARESA